MPIFIIVVLITSLLFADDFDFDLDEIEVKSYEYNGYVKAEHKYQKTKNDDTLKSKFGEAMFDFKYFKNNFTFNTQFQANHTNINNKETDKYTTNQLFVDYKVSSNHSLKVGKESLKWGKGYFFNPIAFLDRKKDPNNPEASKEGYFFTHYKYNKSYNNNLKNFSFDMIYMPTSKDINKDFDEQKTNTLAFKTYFLYFDTDIDIVYLHNDKLKNKIGFDLSKNLKTNFEIHAEFGKEFDGYYSYLLGLKYLTVNDLTITSEYFYQSCKLQKLSPFYDNRYFINKFSLKEPFDIVYFSIYYKNSLNLNDNSHQNSLGLAYKFKNNVNIDISYIKNIGNTNSEFGGKNISDTIWSKIIWYF